jgi:hypothetical protein
MVYDSGEFEGLRYRVTCREGLWYVQSRYYGHHPWLDVAPRSYTLRDAAVDRMFELVKSRDNPKQDTKIDVEDDLEPIYEEDIRETWEYIEK